MQIFFPCIVGKIQHSIRHNKINTCSIPIANILSSEWSDISRKHWRTKEISKYVNETEEKASCSPWIYVGSKFMKLCAWCRTHFHWSVDFSIIQMMQKSTKRSARNYIIVAAGKSTENMYVTRVSDICLHIWKTVEFEPHVKCTRELGQQLDVSI